MPPSASPPSRNASRLRMAAVDLDGTLLDHNLSISPENLRAVEKMQAAGLEVVLASGRHYHSMRPFADRLPGMRWIVSSQGGEVSDLNRSLVLHRSSISPLLVEQILEAGGRLGVTVMAYSPDGIFTETEGGAGLSFYSQLAGYRPIRTTRAEILSLQVQKVSWVGEPDQISSLVGNPELRSLAVPQVRTHARLYEFLPEGANKGTGVAALAAHLGMSAAEVVVFGDADNDIPMFEWAGISVAMPHGWPETRARASLVGPAAPPAVALARAVDAVFC